MYILTRSDRGGGTYRYWSGSGWECEASLAKVYLTWSDAKRARTVVERNTCLDLAIEIYKEEA